MRGDISDTDLITRVFREHQPRAVVNFAAETHVDRSIKEPKVFLQTNVGRAPFVGVCQNLLEPQVHQIKKRFGLFRFQQMRYMDHDEGRPHFRKIVFGLIAHMVQPKPLLTTLCVLTIIMGFQCSQLIALIIMGPTVSRETNTTTICNAITHKPLPIYGDGLQIRDWLYVSDHCNAMCLILENGKISETQHWWFNN